MTDDWSDACDPVPARRELTEAEKRRRIALKARERRNNWLAADADMPSTYHVESGFDELEA